MQDADRLLDTALALAERQGWEAVRLHAVAAAAGVTLDDIRRHYREKDALIDAWFDRADGAALALAARGELAGLTPRQRLFRLIMAWLTALAAHRRVTREMILAKLEPGHIHIQFPAITRISRTVQWLREAAELEDSGLARAVAETACTGIYLAAFTCWLNEDDDAAPRTRRLLDDLLGGAERVALSCPLFGGTAVAAPGAEASSADAPGSGTAQSAPGT